MVTKSQELFNTAASVFSKLTDMASHGELNDLDMEKFYLAGEEYMEAGRAMKTNFW